MIKWKTSAIAALVEVLEIQTCVTQCSIHFWTLKPDKPIVFKPWIKLPWRRWKNPLCDKVIHLNSIKWFNKLKRNQI